MNEPQHFLNKIISCDLEDSKKSQILNSHPLSEFNCIIDKEFAVKYLSFLTYENRLKSYEFLKNTKIFNNYELGDLRCLSGDEPDVYYDRALNDNITYEEWASIYIYYHHHGKLTADREKQMNLSYCPILN